MRRRLRRLLLTAGAGLLVLGVLAMVLIGRIMEPARLTPWLLERAGETTGLELRVREPAAYTLRPTPSLVLRGLTAHLPGEPETVFAVDRVEISLPWRTLRGQSAEVTRIELDTVVVDLGQLARWLQRRPATDEPFRIPTLSDGIVIRDGTLLAPDWRLEGVELVLDRVTERRASSLQASADMVFAERTMPLRLDVEGVPRNRGDGIELTVAQAMLALRTADDAQAPVLDARLAGELAWRDERLALDFPDFSLRGHFPDPELDFTATLPLKVDVGEGRGELQPAALELSGGTAIPALRGVLRSSYGEELSVDFSGRLAAWPSAWPPLPLPAGTDPSDLDIEASYRGDPGLQQPVRLALDGPGLRGEATGAARPLLDWLGQRERALLPPLHADLQLDSLEVAGANLSGVRLVIDESNGPGPQP